MIDLIPALLFFHLFFINQYMLSFCYMWYCAEC